MKKYMLTQESLKSDTFIGNPQNPEFQAMNAYLPKKKRGWNDTWSE